MIELARAPRTARAPRGFCTGHLGAEAAIGGPIALLRDDDIIGIDAETGILALELSGQELVERLKSWKPPEGEYGSGTLWCYPNTVGDAKEALRLIRRQGRVVRLCGYLAQARDGVAMRQFVEAILLQVFVGEEDRYGGHHLCEAIVAAALERRMAGATVLPGAIGFGRSPHVRCSELNVDAGPRSPIVIEIVDSEEQINRFLPVLHEMVESGLVSMEKVRAIRYRRRDSLEEAQTSTVDCRFIEAEVVSVVRQTPS